MGLVRDSKVKWKRTERWLSGYSTYHTSQRIGVGSSESKLVIREVWWHTCNSAWEGWEKECTEARWLGDYRDCWSSRIEWDSLPQNKVEEWTRRNSDINLELSLCTLTHVQPHTCEHEHKHSWHTWKEDKEKRWKMIEEGTQHSPLCITCTYSYNSMHVSAYIHTYKSRRWSII